MAAPHTPQVRVDAGFGHSPTDEAVTWVDITTSAVSDMAIYRGRSSELDRFSPASLTLRMTDASRDLDPTNLSGTYVESVTVESYPTVGPSVDNSSTTFGTDSAQAIPATYETGDLLLAFVAVDQNGSATGVSLGTGSAVWTELFDSASGTVVRLACYARIATGTDTLVLTGASQDYICSVFVVAGHGCTTTADVEVGSADTGTTGGADPFDINAGARRKWLWIAGCAVDGTTGTTLDQPPPGFTAINLEKSAESTSSVHLGVAYRQYQAESLNPAPFNSTSGRTWVTRNIAVPPASTAHDRTQVSPGVPVRVTAVMPSRGEVFNDTAAGPEMHSGWRAVSGAVTAEPSGEYAIPPGTVLRGPSFNFDGDSTFQVGTQSDGASPNHDVRIVLSNGGYVGWNLTGTTFTYLVNDGGSTADDTTAWADITFRYVRIRFDGDDVIWERSGNASSWTTIDTYTRGVDFANTVDWSYGYLYLANNSASTTVELDNFIVEVSEHTRFRGAVDSWQFTPYPGNAAGDVQLAASDAFKYLANTQLPQRWQTAVQELDPVAWYPLGERDGNIAYDATGHGFDGTYPPRLALQGGDPVTPPMGNGSVRMQHAYPPDFYGVRLHDGARRNTYPYTINMWMKAAQEFPRDVSIYASGNSLPGALFSQGPDGNSMWIDIYILSGEITTSGSFDAALNWRIGVDWYSNRTSGRRLYFRTPLGDALPHMITVVVTGDEGVLCYVDGVIREAVHYLEADFASELDATPGVWIGPPNFIPFPSTPFNTGFWGLEGAQDEVTIHAEALTTSEIETLYAAASRVGEGDTTGERIHRVLDLIGWPAGLRQIDTGETTMSPDYLYGESVLSYLQKVEVTEGGRLFIGRHGEVVFHDARTVDTVTTAAVTFDDSGSAGPQIRAGFQVTHDDTFLYTGASVTRDGGLEQAYQDADAVTRYGARDWSASLLSRTDVEARLRAVGFVEKYKEPMPRVGGWQVTPQKDPTDWPAVLNLNLGDTAHLVFTLLNTGDEYDQNLDLATLNERVSGGAWTMDLAATPMDPGLGNVLEWDSDSGVTDSGWGFSEWR